MTRIRMHQGRVTSGEKTDSGCRSLPPNMHGCYSPLVGLAGAFAVVPLFRLVPFWSPEAVLTNLSIQRLRRDPEHLGGLALMPLRLQQHRLDVAPLELFECELASDHRRRGAGRRRQIERQVLSTYDSASREEYRALDDVAQLADVARPLVFLQQREGIGRERR